MNVAAGGIVNVLLPLALQGPYSYSSARRAPPGTYVVAPLGSRQYIGVVWESGGAAPDPAKLREIVEVMDHEPMPETHRRFIDWVANYYLAPAGSVLRMCLRVPAALGSPPTRGAFRLTGSAPAKLTPARLRVMERLAGMPALAASEISALAGVGASVIKGLVAEGVLERVETPAVPRFAEPDPRRAGLALTLDQKHAADILCRRTAAAGHSVTLIDGVTGSGKTEVYFEAMARAVAMGAQTLLLVPEIALTQQFIDRVEDRFGARPAEWHSGVRPGERERVWRAVSCGEVSILVGARSALFLPWRQPGLIVVDEEHESAFKQEDGVSYHARDMAVVYGALGAFPVVLSSATPSLETLANVKRGRYGIVTLKDRIGRAKLPTIDLIDMRAEKTAGGRWLSTTLAQAVGECLGKGEQALLFLNRRGYAPLTVCRACGFRIDCPNCSSSLVEHRFKRMMLCHHCGHMERIPKACSACGSEGVLVACGPGVERLAEEARTLWPEARLAILSSDLIRGPSLKDTLREIAAGDHDLIIGTQLVAKGHHFPQLTLVGVVDADLALETTDPRAGERTFQLLCQVSGRAGRGDIRGRAFIQTYNPGHALMRALASGDGQGFLAQEMAMRERASLPPFGRLAAVIVSGTDALAAERLARGLARTAPSTQGIELLGPAPAPIPLIGGRHRWRLLLRAGRSLDVQGYIRRWFADAKAKGSLRIDVDIDPYNFL
jgi:primosomal protein N' (replication factor Y)